MDSPSVYIITLNWNGLEDTLECLRSLEQMTYPNVKAVVVDNGSRDAQADRIQADFPEAIVLKQSENVGFCRGCNIGIEYALSDGADFVMLLNNDTIVSESLLEKLLAGIERLDDAAAVSPLITYYPDTNKVWFAKAEWNPERAAFSLDPEPRPVEELQGAAPYQTSFACGCCLLAPANIFREQGLLDERYFAFFDEADWCARVERMGLKSYVIPSAIVYHKVSRSTPGPVSGYLMTRNRLLWMKENLPIGTRVKSLSYLAFDLVGHAASVLRLTKEHYPRNYSRAVLLGYRDYFLRRFYKWDRSLNKVLLDS